MQSRGSPGTIDSHDRSNLNFSEDEVAQNRNGVLAQIAEWKKCRRDQLITAAIFARCHALDVFRISDGKQATALIDMGLDHSSGYWSHSDFLAACILLRGCAKSLLPTTKSDQIDERRSQFTRHLREPDLVLKSHAAVSVSRSPIICDCKQHRKFPEHIELTRWLYSSLLYAICKMGHGTKQASNCSPGINGFCENGSDLSKDPSPLLFRTRNPPPPNSLAKAFYLSRKIRPAHFKTPTSYIHSILSYILTFPHAG